MRCSCYQLVMPNCTSALVSFACVFPIQSQLRRYLHVLPLSVSLSYVPSSSALALHSRSLFLVFAFVMPSRNQFAFRVQFPPLQFRFPSLVVLSWIQMRAAINFVGFCAIKARFGFKSMSFKRKSHSVSLHRLLARMCFRCRSKSLRLHRVCIRRIKVNVVAVTVSSSCIMLSLSRDVHSTSTLKFAARSHSLSVRVVIFAFVTMFLLQFPLQKGSADHSMSSNFSSSSTH